MQCNAVSCKTINLVSLEMTTVMEARLQGAAVEVTPDVALGGSSRVRGG